MSRFTRFSCVSPLALCLERERRAWCCAAGVVALIAAVAVVGGCFHVAGAFVPGGSGAMFTHLSLPAAEGKPQTAPVALRIAVPDVVPFLPPVELVLQQLPPEPVVAELHELQQLDLPVAEDGGALAVAEWLPLPESLAVDKPRRRGQKTFSGASAASRSAAEHTDGVAAVRGAGELVPASYCNTPHPPYPPRLLSRRVQGRVGLRITLDAEGIPQLVEVCAPSGHVEFDRVAREWVMRHWRFNPARRAGVAEASTVRTQVVFSLH